MLADRNESHDGNSPTRRKSTDHPLLAWFQVTKPGQADVRQTAAFSLWYRSAILRHSGGRSYSEPSFSMISRMTVLFALSALALAAASRGWGVERETDSHWHVIERRPARANSCRYRLLPFTRRSDRRRSSQSQRSCSCLHYHRCMAEPHRTTHISHPGFRYTDQSRHHQAADESSNPAFSQWWWGVIAIGGHSAHSRD
jgi:hypothetical protein